MDFRKYLTRNRFSKRRVAKAPELSRYTVDHASIAEYVRDELRERSTIFDKSLARLPVIEIDSEVELEDGTVEKIHERREIKSAADISSDLWFAFHDERDLPVVKAPNQVPPSRELVRSVMEEFVQHEDVKVTRSRTKGDDVSSALALLAAQDVLFEELTTTLRDRLDEAEQMQEQEQVMGGCEGVLGGTPGGSVDANGQPVRGSVGLREEAKALHDAGQPIPQELREKIKETARAKAEARAKLEALAEQMQTGLDEASKGAVERASEAAKEITESWASLPGNGVGQRHNLAPDDVLKTARKFLSNEVTREVARLMGRMERDFRYQHSTHTVGGHEIPVGIELGNDLDAVLASERRFLAQPELRPLFYKRFLDRQLLQFEYVGTENSGKGPFIMLLDFSGSMGGDRHVWAKAVALSLLSIAYREKRAVTIIGFTGHVVGEWTFPPGNTMDLAQAYDFASRWPDGGTRPYYAMLRAAQIIRTSPTFRQADIVITTDGECGFGEADLKLQDELVRSGVRLHGIAIAMESSRYLSAMCSIVIPVHEMTGPSDATTHLVQAMTAA